MLSSEHPSLLPPNKHRWQIKANMAQNERVWQKWFWLRDLSFWNIVIGSPAPGIWLSCFYCPPAFLKYHSGHLYILFSVLLNRDPGASTALVRTRLWRCRAALRGNNCFKSGTGMDVCMCWDGWDDSQSPSWSQGQPSLLTSPVFSWLRPASQKPWWLCWERQVPSFTTWNN